jgi:hypothetical protein
MNSESDLSLSKIEIATRFNFAWRFQILITLAVIIHMISSPVKVPFVDDWLLIPWGTGQAPKDWAHFWQMVNGHQHNLIKIYVIFLGKFLALNLVTSAVLGTCLGSFGYFLMLWSQVKNLTLSRRQFYLSFAGLSLVLMTWRQMQNFFMIICLPWMMAVFVIGVWLWFKNSKYAGLEKWRWLSIFWILISPMTNALGLVVPLSECVEVTIRLWTDRKLGLRPLVLNVSLGLISLYSVYLSFLYPVWSPSVAKPLAFTTGQGLMPFLLENVWDSLCFVLLAAGQPFVFRSPRSMVSGEVIGALLIILALAALSLRRNRGLIKETLMNKSTLIAGFIFLGIFLAARIRELGVLGAIEPRYTSASVVFSVGVFVLLLKAFPNWKWLPAALLGIGIWCNLEGYKVGNEIYRARSAQARDIVNCFKDHKDTYQIKFDDPCVALAQPQDTISPQAFLDTMVALELHHLSFLHGLRE